MADIRTNAVISNIPMIESLGLSDYVLGLYKEGVSYTEIARRLKIDKNVEISNVSISKWISKQRKELQEETLNDIQKMNSFTKLCTNYEKEIKDILSEVKEMKDVARNEKDVDNYQKLVGRLYQGLELLAKLMGDLKPSGNIDINLIINEVSNAKFDKNRLSKHQLFENKIIDVESEITEQDIESEKELNGDEL